MLFRLFQLEHQGLNGRSVHIGDCPLFVIYVRENSEAVSFLVLDKAHQRNEFIPPVTRFCEAMIGQHQQQRVALTSLSLLNIISAAFDGHDPLDT